MSDAGTERQRTVSSARKSHWPGWIWAVPIAAVGIVVWLLVRATSSRGFDVTVAFDDATGMKANDTKVLYRGVDIGQVSAIGLSGDRRHVQVHLDIDGNMKPDVNSGTRFYLQGGEPSLADPASLKAIVAGPTILMVPGAGSPQRNFTGIEGKSPKPLAASVPYLVTFAGAVGGLQPGSPVTLLGFTVGEVDHVELSTDARTGIITTPVVLLLDPTRFHLRGAEPLHGNWTPLMNSMLAKLVQRNLRARLTKNPPLIGSPQVELDIVAGVRNATLRMQGIYPEIPAVEGGDIGDLPDKLSQLPIRQIGENVRAITERMNALVSSPQLQDSIRHLDRTLAELDKTMQEVEPQVGPTLESAHHAVDSLRKAASEIDATSASARKMMGASAVSPNGNLEQALHELTGAARAIRTLADYLDQHPEALLRGRPDEETMR